MINVWRVQWTDEGRKYRNFPGDRPTEAVGFAKTLKFRGLDVEVFSTRRAFPPPAKARIPDTPGTLWCPYCVKWRAFHEVAVRRDGYTTPVLLRCPVCTISIKDAYVRSYNPLFYAKYEVAQEMRRKSLAEKRAQKNKLSSVSLTRKNRRR